MDDDPRNRKARRAARRDGHLDTATFLKLADRFIDVANTQNKTVQATHLHMAFLYGAARYNAHVAKNVLNVDDHEKFVGEMTKSYQEMLRNHLADPAV
ncbi:hypothetical protein MNBD_ALPHA09-1488 [hydrothermal vent metagenome]|uniref:DUF3144 domain-containing protein n=1 Tax=hydrothermal vent metagenome TaxID=652676 RepID=A0A3B0TXS4_9ZZZZ